MRRGTHRIRDASATDGKETAQTDQIALETLGKLRIIVNKNCTIIFHLHIAIHI